MLLQKDSLTSESTEDSTNVYHLTVTLNHTLGLLLASKENTENSSLQGKKNKRKKKHTTKNHHPTNAELENRTTKTTQTSPPHSLFFWVVLQNLTHPEDTAGTRRRNTRNCRVKYTSEAATPFPAFLLHQHTLQLSIKHTIQKVKDYTSFSIL